MTTSEPHDEVLGVLSIEDGGGASWFSEQVAALGAIRIRVGDGAVIEVDAARPDVVLAWTVRLGGDLERLGAAFGDTELPERIRALQSAADEVFVDSAPTLTEPWLRRATVAAVRRFAVRPVHEVALLLDQATADHAIGDAANASYVFELAAPALIRLGQRCLAGDIVGAAATDLAGIASAAVESLDHSGWLPDVSALADELAQTTWVIDEDLSALLKRAEVGSSVLAAPDGGVQSALLVIPQHVDPTVVPGRILAWPGAATSDILVEFDTDTQMATISALLARGVKPDSDNATALIAYAANDHDGTIVAVTPMRALSGTVTARLRCTGHDPDALVFGIHHADFEATALRSDPLGRELAMVDRYVTDAFAHQRSAYAVLHAMSSAGDVNKAQSESRDRLMKAQRAAKTAISLIERVSRRAASDEVRRFLEARRTAIEDYVDRLAVGSAPRSSEPLLAELLPNEDEPEPHGH